MYSTSIWITLTMQVYQKFWMCYFGYKIKVEVGETWGKHVRIMVIISERQTSLSRNSRFGVATGTIIWMLRKWRMKVWIRPNMFRRRSSVNIINPLGSQRQAMLGSRRYELHWTDRHLEVGSVTACSRILQYLIKQFQFSYCTLCLMIRSRYRDGFPEWCQHVWAIVVNHRYMSRGSC
jgi:hypothetical protein